MKLVLVMFNHLSNEFKNTKKNLNDGFKFIKTSLLFSRKANYYLLMKWELDIDLTFFDIL